MKAYKIDSEDQVEKLNMEGRFVKVLLKDGVKIEGDVYYQGNLDFQKLNNNLGSHSIGYNYIYFDDKDIEVKYSEISEIAIYDLDDEID